MRGIDFKWYDGFFLSMLATSAIIVSINWKRYHSCTYPLHIWILVDYTTVFVFRVLMFVDNGLAAGMGLDLGRQQRFVRFCGRIVVLSILVLILYPFLWAWTVIGSIWFTSARNCLPENGQKWGFLIWLLFSFCGLICIACMSTGKWLMRRQAHLQRAQGFPISEFGVLVDLIRVPEWAFEAAGQELRGMGQDTATYHPGLYLTPAQREAVEALIQELPKFRMKAVPTDCSECPICLEEFRVGNEVRGLPCAHNFHVECIDEWLRLNIKCPRCRCSVFPNLDLSALANTQRPQTGDSSRSSQASASSFTSMPSSRYIRAQPMGQSNLLRLQDLLRTIRVENSVHSEMSIGERATNLAEGSVTANLESNQLENSRHLSNEIHASIPNGYAAGNPNNTDPPTRNGVHRQVPYNVAETVTVVVDRSPPARF